ARILLILTTTMALCFSLTSALVGFKVIAENLAYRGPVLTGADVPLLQKLQVADFVATDWQRYSSSDRIPVAYDLGGGRWDWVTSFGRTLLRWYRAPYTMGRAFDYTLLRGYGLSNTQEGIQRRSSDKARYLVTYAFLPAPTVHGASALHHYTIGRLRVTIIDR
ncbi:MAG TPA: hypothetical protein VLL49_12070, partial [Anaerolineales bacterium]|nr:hypothetical protein [Anaerolineales bacterium]